VGPVVELQLLGKGYSDEDDDLKVYLAFVLFQNGRTNLETLDQIDGDLIPGLSSKVAHRNICVEFGQSRERRCGAGLANILRS